MVQIPNEILVKIAEYICGDVHLFPYRTGRDLSLFFGDAGLPYSHNGTSRKWWTLDVLKKINTDIEKGLPSIELTRVIECLVAPHNSESENQQREQISTIDHLLKQFNLRIGYIDLENNVKLFYKNRRTGKTEYYEGQIPVIADDIKWIKIGKNKTSIKKVDKGVRDMNFNDEIGRESTKSMLLKKSEENTQLLSKIDEKLEDFSQTTEYKLNAIKGNTEYIIEEVSQLEQIFDRIEDLEGFLIKNLGSDYIKIKYAWNKCKDGQITKKEFAKECFKALGRQAIKKIWKV